MLKLAKNYHRLGKLKEMIFCKILQPSVTSLVFASRLHSDITQCRTLLSVSTMMVSDLSWR